MNVVALDDYLDGAGAKAWGYGGRGINCLTLLAGWAYAQTGIDRGIVWARHYRSLSQARVLLDRNGGTLAFMDRETALCGYRRTDEPEYGDIGLVEVPIETEGKIEKRLIGAISYGASWVLRDENALIYVPDITPAIAWTLAKP